MAGAIENECPDIRRVGDVGWVCLSNILLCIRLVENPHHRIVAYCICCVGDEEAAVGTDVEFLLTAINRSVNDILNRRILHQQGADECLRDS